MLNPKNNKAGWSTGLLIAALITTVMGGAAYASKGLVQDRRVNMSEAKRMLQNLSGNAEFPIALNDQVLRELNRYIGTPEGRDFFKKSLLRMKDFQPLVDTKLSDYQAPAEFSAIPIVESGYQNLADDGISHHGAGIWMFIQSTARNYHLRVDDTVDERMDSKLLTDAAMRYLTANQMRFGDWRLAVLAYNMGESAVQKAIIDSGTRDPWVISDYSNDQYYLPRLMAAILIMKNPRTIE